MESIWQKENNQHVFSSLRDDLTCDAAVVGGGLCGVLCAYMLYKAGLKTVLLEAERLGSGQSSLTTAKITSSHGSVYSKIAKYFGKDMARLYGEACDTSIREYAKTVAAEKIDCDFEMLPCCLYSLYGRNLIASEYEAASYAGLNCSITNETSLPFYVESALRFENQAQFHPIKFINALAENLHVYEHSRVTELRGDRLICKDGSVKARYVVIATNYPILGDARDMFPVKLHRKMAHVCAFEGSSHLHEMYVGADGGYNYRSYKDILIVSGENHISGLGTGGAYERIIKSTSMHFEGTSPTLHWSAEDSETTDHLPHIGHMKGKDSDFFMATGFGTWGMTTSMTSAMIIRDMICGKENKSSELFSPKRFKMNASAEELSDAIARSTKGIALSRLKVPEDELSDLPHGEAKIIRHMGRKIGAYRDENGNIHKIDPKCPHLGCELKWNGDDKTWDCPCHGSRFDMDGHLLNGPAQRNTVI